VSQRPCTVLLGQSMRKPRILEGSPPPSVQAITLWLLIPWAAFGQVGVSTLKTGAPPAWVEWAAPEAKTAIRTDQESGGQVFTLFDTQVNVPIAESFVHVVKEITTTSGVQTGANLEFTWDPSFQELIFHEITIQRGAERMARLDPGKFKVIQQETDLNRQIYNGALSALLFLEDVRVGDRIEYAYTLRGENPSLKGRYAASFTVGWPLPVQHRRILLLWPAERGLRFQLHGISTTVKPEVRVHPGIKEYVWEVRDVPAVVVEDQLPSWFPAYPWIQLTEFTNWSDVATWAMGLYITTNADAPELKEEIAMLRRPGATPEQMVQGALEFAQNDIRYLGIEFGPNSYHPTDPATVLRRRFGDCKDKAFLLCTLLRGLGFDAAPVLVATGFHHTLPELLPAPYDFDHVIVRVVADGVTYWLDPTRSYQRGPIAQRYLPAYSFGLPVQPGLAGLVPIPISGAGAPETFTTETFRVGGQKAPTRLSVTTTCRGFDAEWMRAVLASEGRERLAKSYLNDYAQRYPGVMSLAPMVVEDSPNSDTVTLSHTYSVTNFWVLSADKQRYSCQFYPLGIHTWIAKPTTAVRSMPMELSFARRRSVRTRIELPREFALSNSTNTIAGPAAELQVKRAYRGQTVWLDYEYRALTNFVPVSLTAAHLKSLDQMEDVLNYALNWQNKDGVAGRSGFNWPIFMLGAVYAGLFLTGAGLLSHRQCRSLSAGASAEPPLLDPKLSGLGGWLILVGIGLVCSPLRVLGSMIQSLDSFSPANWYALTHPGGVSYHPAWGTLLTLELLSQITVLILSLFVVVLFFQKRRIFPRWFITLLVLNSIFILGDEIAVHIVKTPSAAATLQVSRTVMQVFIGCAIWIPYMCVSRRVKATFVR
jgi:transglutaminase-like putative cysteine protease